MDYFSNKAAKDILLSALPVWDLRRFSNFYVAFPIYSRVAFS